MTPIYSYQNRAVRDLAWACFSPGLMHPARLLPDAPSVTACEPELTAARQAWLQALDQQPEPLLKHLRNSKSQRLGIYFERLWHFFLDQDPAFELLAHNLPVRQEGRTLGEFDCLYFCRERQRHVHLELAVKFYLGHRQLTRSEPESQWCEWLGPDNADRLDLKLDHLMRHQIQLAQLEEAREALAGVGVSEANGEVLREVAIKGDLFQCAVDPLPPPLGFNVSHGLSRWVPLAELEGFLSGQEAHTCLVLPKKRWLSRSQLEPDDAPLTPDSLCSSIRKHFATERRTKLIALLDRNGSERQRFFITGDHWPVTQALAFSRR